MSHLNTSYKAILLSTLLFMLYTFQAKAGATFQKISNTNTVVLEVNNFYKNYPNSIIGFTVNIQMLMRFRSDNNGAAIRILNGLYTPDINKMSNHLFLISLYDKNNMPLHTDKKIMQNSYNLCPTNCDKLIVNGTPFLANGSYLIETTTANTYEENYTSTEKNEISSIYIPSDIIDIMINQKAVGIRVYLAIDSNTQKKCVYVCGLDNNANMVSSMIYKGYDTNLCPTNCD